MRKAAFLLGIVAAAASAGGATAGGYAFDPGTSPSGIHYRNPWTPPPKDTPPSPYPMTYADEAAQTLGIRNGQMDIFRMQPGRGNAPFVSGSVDGGAAMLKLQWRPDGR